MTSIRTDDFVRRLASGIIISCLVVFAATVGALAMPGMRAKLGFASAAPLSYAVGERIDVPSSAYESTPYTLVVFARSSCGACQRSKPFFADLVSQLRKQQTTRVVMLTGTTFRQDELKFARELGLHESDVVRADLKKLRARRVPTLVLVDRQGKVLFEHEGAPSPGEENRLVRKVTALAQEQ